jgi:hypothetical protein
LRRAGGEREGEKGASKRKNPTCGELAGNGRAKREQVRGKKTTCRGQVGSEGGLGAICLRLTASG